ncbi:hypothetical protein ABW21_db0202112 [Orbilia brochopaga]|nr:hypothetical protein ABW21_db0202112 [Drechslerella brochopaga]
MRPKADLVRYGTNDVSDSTGPADDVSTFSKRDGSHMELFDCPTSRKGDNGVHKAKAVCRGDPENCNKIFKLEGGVAGTFIKMPSHFVTGVPISHKRSERILTVDDLYEKWESMLSMHPDTNVIEKRTAENWLEHDARALHPRFFSPDSENWNRVWEILLFDWDQLTLFDKKWDFKIEKNLFKAEKTCTFNGGSLKAEASANVEVQGTAKVLAGASFVVSQLSYAQRHSIRLLT